MLYLINLHRDIEIITAMEIILILRDIILQKIAKIILIDIIKIHDITALEEI